MTDEQTESLEPNIKVKKSMLEQQKRVRGERYRRIYTNNMFLEFSKWDVSLVFGEIMEGSGDVHTVEEIAHVTMSHSFAKAVMNVLAQNIAAFEKQFGEIKVPALETFIEQTIPPSGPAEPAK